MKSYLFLAGPGVVSRSPCPGKAERSAFPAMFNGHWPLGMGAKRKPSVRFASAENAWTAFFSVLLDGDGCKIIRSAGKYLAIGSAFRGLEA